MDNSTIFGGKVYLIKIKEYDNFGARDMLWAIGQVMSDPLDYTGLKSLVVGINSRGLFSNLLSESKCINVYCQKF